MSDAIVSSQLHNKTTYDSPPPVCTDVSVVCTTPLLEQSTWGDNKNLAISYEVGGCGVQTE